jgi:hypothetical protein
MHLNTALFWLKIVVCLGLVVGCNAMASEPKAMFCIDNLTACSGPVNPCLNCWESHPEWGAWCCPQQTPWLCIDDRTGLKHGCWADPSQAIIAGFRCLAPTTHSCT